jgi:hypothetical protein
LSLLTGDYMPIGYTRRSSLSVGIPFSALIIKDYFIFLAIVNGSPSSEW